MTSTAWRWDQGRLNYFSLDNMRRIASTVSDINGLDLTKDAKLMRSTLEYNVGLPFAPAHYHVWRNYARVFKILGLASKIDNKLTATGLCAALVKTNSEFITNDDYMHHLIRVFYYPSPVFEGYTTKPDQKFPFCAVLKYLFASVAKKSDPSINVATLYSVLVGNDVSGMENIASYAILPTTKHSANGYQNRQAREMLIFMSQLSYLSWFRGRLFIDSEFVNALSSEDAERLTTPRLALRTVDPEVEIQRMFDDAGGADFFTTSINSPADGNDFVFTEGKKIRINHLRTERNQKIVSLYFKNTRTPYLCDMCDVEVRSRYPWVNNLIEVHHVLPLASAIRVDMSGTSLDDLVGLCPNCHRATHTYYRNYLTTNSMPDFQSNDHAREVYNIAKSSYVEVLPKI